MTRFRPYAVPLLIAAVSCTTSETMTSPEMRDPIAREARVTGTVNYAATDLGTLPGDERSNAWAVNNAGSVAVSSSDYPSTGGIVNRWYIQTGAARTFLPNALINALSSGSTTDVVGWDVQGEKWAYSVSSGFSAPTALPGYPRAVNDLGHVAGETSGGASIIMPDGSVITQANPDPAMYSSTEARDINNSDDIVIIYQDNYVTTPDRGYLRLADGTMIEFAPLAGHVSTYARGVSERIDGKVYVAGISDDDNGNYNAVRWTVDVATHAIVGTEVGGASSYSTAMSDDGMIVGAIYGSTATPFVWKRGGAITALKAPKGLSDAAPRGVSGNGRYIAGDGQKGQYRRAILWTAQ